jgi:hypothetical protein
MADDRFSDTCATEFKIVRKPIGVFERAKIGVDFAALARAAANNSAVDPSCKLS